MMNSLPRLQTSVLLELYKTFTIIFLWKRGVKHESINKTKKELMKWIRKDEKSDNLEIRMQASTRKSVFEQDSQSSFKH